MRNRTRLLVAACLACSLVGCKSAGQQSTQDSVAPAAGQDSATSNASSSFDAAPIEETVLIDEAGIRVTAQDIDTSSASSPAITLQIENSSGHDLALQCQSVSVNGNVVDAWMDAQVDDGQQKSCPLTLDQRSLSLSGIQTISSVELSIVAYDAQSWEELRVFGPITLGSPAASGTDAAPATETSPSQGVSLYEGNGLIVRSLGRASNENETYPGQSVVIEIVSSRDDSVTVSSRDTTVNGKPIEPDFAISVGPGKRAVTTMTFASDMLASNGIEQIEMVETSLTIFDTDAWQEVAVTDPVTITL